MLRTMSLEEKVGQMVMVWARIQFLNVQVVKEIKEMQKENCFVRRMWAANS